MNLEEPVKEKKNSKTRLWPSVCKLKYDEQLNTWYDTKKCSSQPFQTVLTTSAWDVSIGQLLSDDFAAVTTGVV